MARQPNGLAVTCPVARATRPSLSGNLAGKTSSNLPHASLISFSELLARYLS